MRLMWLPLGTKGGNDFAFINCWERLFKIKSSPPLLNWSPSTGKTYLHNHTVISPKTHHTSPKTNIHTYIFCITCSAVAWSFDVIQKSKLSHRKTFDSWTDLQNRHICIWVSFCRTGKMSKLCLKKIFFGASLWPNGSTFSTFLNCSEEVLSCTV